MLDALLRGGARTSEFWLTLLIVLLLVAGAVEKILPADTAATLGVITAAIYKGLRTYLKLRASGFALESLQTEIDAGSATLSTASPVSERAPGETPAAALETSAPPIASAPVKGSPFMVIDGGKAPLGIFALSALFAVNFLCGCTTVYERGQKLAVIGSNLKGLHLVSARGTHLDIAEVDNSGIHRAVGSAVANGAVSAGTAVATSGILGVIK